MKQKDITKKFTFDKEELEKLKNIKIGMINASATMDGLQIYQNVLLEGVYRRLGINGEAKKGYKKSIQYNLSENIITLTETETKDKEVVKKK